MKYAFGGANLDALVVKKGRTAGCRGCIHYGPNDGACSYLLNTGVRRPCKPKPGGGCDAKDTGKARRKNLRLE